MLPSDSLSRLDNDSLTMIFELVGPDGWLDDRRVEHLRRPHELAAAQRDLHGWRRISRRIGSVAGTIAQKHLGASARARSR